MDCVTFFENRGLPCRILPFSACHVTRPYLLDKIPLQPKTVILLLAPYGIPDPPVRNLSRYAQAKDYHLFFSDLFSECIPLLQGAFPGFTFIGFSDHSPIDEIHSAALAGLGILGDQGLLLHETYGSRVFIGEIFTDCPLPASVSEPRFCLHCGKCRASCPSPAKCLSALTQKKGELTGEEVWLLQKNDLAWGCDRCQEVCPLAMTPKETPLSFFKSDLIPFLTAKDLVSLPDEEFSKRAYGWRKKEVLLRNLRLREDKEKNGK